MRVAVIGTGLMGAPIAANLARAGHATTVWNRSPEKAEALRPAGCKVAATPNEAIADAEVVVSMLDSAAATDAVFFVGGAVKAIRAKAVLVVMSSLSPAQSREHAAHCEALGIGYVDAPVSGGPEGARNATLAIMAGGSAEPVSYTHLTLPTKRIV